MSSWYDCTILADSPLSYWKLSDTTTTAKDLGSLANNGAYAGSYTQSEPALIKTDPSVCTLFNGTSGYMDATNKSGYSVNTTNSLTVEAWIQISGTWGNAIIASKNSSSSNFEWQFYTNTGGIMAFAIYQTGTSTTMATSGNVTGLVTGTTYHVVGTVTLSSSIVLYINGTVGNSSTTFTGSYGSTTALVNIARRGDNSNFIHAYMSDVAIYSTALSQARITAHYNAGKSAPGFLTFI